MFSQLLREFASNNDIRVGAQTIAVRTLRSNGVNSTQYLHKDSLGSVDAITDEQGAVVERLSYDSFGKRRLETWDDDGTDTMLLASHAQDRGYTGHEHLDHLALIHMNGRVYDPVLGRMISADPTVPNPWDLQSHNRYSYVNNNPLTFTDPSGFDPEPYPVTIPVNCTSNCDDNSIPGGYSGNGSYVGGFAGSDARSASSLNGLSKPVNPSASIARSMARMSAASRFRSSSEFFARGAGATRRTGDMQDYTAYENARNTTIEKGSPYSEIIVLHVTASETLGIPGDVLGIAGSAGKIIGIAVDYLWYADYEVTYSVTPLTEVTTQSSIWATTGPNPVVIGMTTREIDRQILAPLRIVVGSQIIGFSGAARLDYSRVVPSRCVQVGAAGC